MYPPLGQGSVPATAELEEAATKKTKDTRCNKNDFCDLQIISSKCPTRNSEQGMILQKLINIKELFAAQGGALCKKNSADSGQFMQNPSGESDFGSFCRKFRLKATSLRHIISNKITQNQGRHTLLRVSGRTLRTNRRHNALRCQGNHFFRHNYFLQ